jgi:hypothetical protein
VIPLKFSHSPSVIGFRQSTAEWEYHRHGKVHVYFSKTHAVDKNSVLSWWKGETADLVSVYSSQHTVVHRNNLFYFKRYLNRSFFDLVKGIVRRSRARRALEIESRMQKAGFGTAQGVCLIEVRQSVLITRCGIVSTALPAQSLWDYVQNKVLIDLPQPVVKRKLLITLAQEVSRLHKAGFYHGDLRLSNIFAAYQNKTFRFYFIDNERSKQAVKLRRRQWAHNLVRLSCDRDGITQTDRIRFWNQYAESMGFSNKEKKYVKKRIMKRWKQKGWI